MGRVYPIQNLKIVNNKHLCIYIQEIGTKVIKIINYLVRTCITIKIQIKNLQDILTRTTQKEIFQLFNYLHNSTHIINFRIQIIHRKNIRYTIYMYMDNCFRT